jgi:hypothetical protein
VPLPKVVPGFATIKVVVTHQIMKRVEEIVKAQVPLKVVFFERIDLIVA